MIEYERQLIELRRQLEAVRELAEKRDARIRKLEKHCAEQMREIKRLREGKQ